MEPNATPPTTSTSWGKWIRSHAYICGASFCMSLAGSMVLMASPFLFRDAGDKGVGLGVFQTMWLGIYTVVCLVISRRLVDRLDRWRTAAIAALVAAALTLGAAAFPTPWYFYAYAVAFGPTIAFFWPMVMATLGEGQDARGVAKAIGPFNLSWSIAWIPGTVLAGAAYEVSPRLPFLLSAGFYCVAALLVSLRRRRKHQARATPAAPDQPLPVPEQVNRRYLLAVWIATPLAGVAVAVIRPFLQLAALQEGMSRLNVNLLVAVLPLVQSMVYYGACQVQFWHYRRLPLVIVAAVGAVGSLVLAAAYQLSMPLAMRVVLTAASLVVVGVCFPLFYTSSLFYGLNVRTGRGANASIHEGLVNTGIATGPLMGGLIAVQWTYPVTFQFAALMMAATAVVLLVMLRGVRSPSDRRV